MAYRNPATNSTPLRIGDKASRLGRAWTLRARITKAVREEGVDYYWDEFVLQSDDGEIAYLEHEDGTWKWMQPFVPRTPISPQEAAARGLGWTLNLDGTAAPVTTNESNSVRFVEGDPGFKVEVGNQSRNIDAAISGKQYSIEWGAKEVEFFRGTTLTVREVYEAFGKADALRDLIRHERKRRSQNVFGGLCAVFSLIALIIWAASGSSGRVVQTGSVALTAVSKEEGHRWGPFSLDPNAKIHRLRVSASMTQAAAWVAGVVESEEEIPIQDAQGDFWDESGYDDGSYHESDLSAQSDFLVTGTGPFYVRVYTEPEPGAVSPYGGSTPSYGNVSFELSEGVKSARWLGWFGLIALPMSLVFFSMGSSERIAKWSAENSD
jgi:hypothetical protein